MPIKKCSSKRTLEYICKCRLSVPINKSRQLHSIYHIPLKKKKTTTKVPFGRLY